MTKKDYQKIAAVLADQKDRAMTAGERAMIVETVIALATMLKIDNPQFNRDRFMAACGWAEGWVGR